MELFFDTETTDLPKDKKPLHDIAQPHIIQLGFCLSDADKIYAEGNLILNPEYTVGRDWAVNKYAEDVHGIGKDVCINTGINPDTAADILLDLALVADTIIAHNNHFDKKLFKILCMRTGKDYNSFDLKPHLCTMLTTTKLCNIPGRYGKPKWPKLIELYKFLFDEEFEGAHDALADVRALRRCYYELVKRGHYDESTG